MDDIAKVRHETEVAKEMIEKLKKTINELESHRKSPLPNNTRWEDIQQHFNNVENAIKEKLNEVEEKKKLFLEKQHESEKQISAREAVVAKLELASLNRIQEVKDKAISAIEEARKNCKAPDLILVNNNTKTSTSDDINEEVNLDNSNYHNRLSAFQTQLKEFCTQMNPKGLLKLFSEHRKYLIKTIKDLPAAMKCAADPGRFVLDSLEGFYPPEPAHNPQEIESSGPQFSRRVCLTLLEVVSSLLREDAQYKSNENKEKAKAIADEWNSKLSGIDIEAANGQSLEAAAFLQLLVTFDIAEKFREDELCKLVFAITKRRQAPELCQALGLAHRMPGVIETLVKTGRHLDAVHFACAFQLTESFPPVPLLDQFLENAKADAKEITDIKEVYNKELVALRAINKCIEEYNLQNHYPLSPVKKKISKLEKMKLEAKRGNQQHSFKSNVSKKGRINKPSTFKKPAYNNPRTATAATVAAYPSYNHRDTSRYSYPAPPAYPTPPPYPASTALYPASAPYDRTASYPPYDRPATYPPAPPPYERSPYDLYAAYGYQSTTAQGSYHGTGGYHSTTTEPSSAYANPGYHAPASGYGYGNYYMDTAAAPGATAAAAAYGSSTNVAAGAAAPSSLRQPYMQR